MNKKTETSQLSLEQYRALQRPVIELPTPTQLFEANVETLVSRGLAKYEDADPFRDNLSSGLFLWIPPRPAETTQEWLDELMSHTEYAGHAGTNHLDVSHLRDNVILFPADLPYMMVDVEDGYDRRNVRCSRSLRDIFDEGRSPYIAVEAVYHAIVLPQFLGWHSMDVVGSMCGDDWVYLFVYVSTGPALEAGRSNNIAAPDYGAASCRGRWVG